MPRILIIDSDPAELNDRARAQGRKGAGEGYAAALRALRDDLEITIVAPYDGEAVPELSGFDGVVFTGSGVEWSTDDARAKPVADVMRRVFAQGLPTIGSCNGMQLAASVLGGSSDVSPNGREDGLAQGIALTEAGRDHPMMVGRTDGYAVPCVHRDEVVRVPQGAVILAGNAHSYVQAMVYERDGISFWGMQYHPEFEPADVGRMLGDDGPLDREVARDLMAAATDAQAAARLGTTCEDQQVTGGRAVELKNWLARL